MSKKEKKQKNVTSKTKGGVGIREQMMIKLLPVTILATVLLTIVSAINSKNTINNEIQDTMKSELQSNSNEINADLETVRSQCNLILLEKYQSIISQHQWMCSRLVSLMLLSLAR